MNEAKFRCGKCRRFILTDSVGHHDQRDEANHGVCEECAELFIIETEAYLRALGLLDLP